MRHTLLSRLARLLLKPLLTRLSDDELKDLLFDAAKTRADSLAPADALRFLFKLDGSLYPVQGWLSVAYDGGLHTKHRHTRYHDFFVNRIRKGERVLDVGCGVGALTYDIAEEARAYAVGIDLSAENIAKASDRHFHPNATYLIGDAVIYAPDSPFDTVVLSNVLEHVEKRPDFVRRIVEAVRPARVLLRVPVFERDWRVPLKKELGVDYRLDPTHRTEYTLESFAEEMQASGLEVIHQEVRWGEIWAEAVPSSTNCKAETLG